MTTTLALQSVKDMGPASTANATRHWPGTAMDLSIPRFSLQPPSGFSLSAGGSATKGTVPSNAPSSSDATSAGAIANGKSAGPVDVISIGDDAYAAGTFTAIAGDTYRISDLFKASVPTGQTIAGFRVALGDAGANGGTLQLDGQDVLDGTTSFSAEQFARLTYTTGASGSQTIVVVAQTGTRRPSLPDGTLGALSHKIDSPAVPITADITGSRSINGMNALITPPGTDAGIVQQAGIIAGCFGSLNATTNFSDTQFDRLTYTTGANGSQNIVVFAQTSTRQPSLPPGTFGVVYGVLCFTAACILVAVLQ